MDINDINFAKNASSTTKSIGHNKYQIEIQELKDTITELTSKIKNKNDDLELFKNNLKDLHIQIQEKNMNLLDTSNQLTITTQNLYDITNKYNEIVILNDKNTNEYKIQYDCLINEKLQLHKNISCNDENIHNLLSKYNELKIKYQDNIILLEKNSLETSNISLLYKNTINELNLYKDLNLTKQNEIDTVKSQLITLNNELGELRLLIHKKDEYLKNFTKKYAYEKPTQQINEQQSNEQNEQQINEQNEQQINEQNEQQQSNSKKSIKQLQRSLRSSKR